MLLLGAKLAAAVVIIVGFGHTLPSIRAIAGALLGFAVLAPFLFCFGIITAYVFDRFRIFRALLPQLLGLAFLVTPVIWRREQLARLKWLADFNPLAHGLDMVRRPLLEGVIPWRSLLVVLGLTCCLAILGRAVHSLNRDLVLFRWIS